MSNKTGLKGSNDQCNSSKPVKNKPFAHRPKTLKKLIPSKTFIQHGRSDRKSCSTGILSNIDKPLLAKPRKTTKSDLTFKANVAQKYSKPAICEQCGDMLAHNTNHYDVNKLYTYENVPTTSYIPPQNQMKRDKSKYLPNRNYKSVEQYYKNENFTQSSDSVHASHSKNILKPPLSTINETIEATSSKSKPSNNVIYEMYPKAVPEEMGYFDLEKIENIKEIKEFRQRNYFECHSAKSRVKVKGSTTSLGEHKCVYRFYLNERLFPIPLNTDHHNNIRCVECKLPVDESRMSQNINGTIQAKVKLNDEVQDMILMLPVKEPLIIKEKRKELQSAINKEVIYFGVIKLNTNGDSVFNNTQPRNSFALKYQKGYKEYERNSCYKYECADNEDVIII